MRVIWFWFPFFIWINHKTHAWLCVRSPIFFLPSMEQRHPQFSCPPSMMLRNILERRDDISNVLGFFLSCVKNMLHWLIGINKPINNFLITHAQWNNIHVNIMSIVIGAYWLESLSLIWSLDVHLSMYTNLDWPSLSSWFLCPLLMYVCRLRIAPVCEPVGTPLSQ